MNSKTAAVLFALLSLGGMLLLPGLTLAPTASALAVDEDGDELVGDIPELPDIDVDQLIADILELLEIDVDGEEEDGEEEDGEQ